MGLQQDEQMTSPWWLMPGLSYSQKSQRTTEVAAASHTKMFHEGSEKSTKTVGKEAADVLSHGQWWKRNYRQRWHPTVCCMCMFFSNTRSEIFWHEILWAISSQCLLYDSPFVVCEKPLIAPLLLWGLVCYSRYTLITGACRKKRERECVKEREAANMVIVLKRKICKTWKFHK